jgi:hypothetical protein
MKSEWKMEIYVNMDEKKVEVDENVIDECMNPQY